jgi:hypothetical protein
VGLDIRKSVAFTGLSRGPSRVGAPLSRVGRKAPARPRRRRRRDQPSSNLWANLFGASVRSPGFTRAGGYRGRACSGRGRGEEGAGPERLSKKGVDHRSRSGLRGGRKNYPADRAGVHTSISAFGARSMMETEAPGVTPIQLSR